MLETPQETPSEVRQMLQVFGFHLSESFCHVIKNLYGLAHCHRMEQNMLPLWQPLSTVALILVVMEIPSREGNCDEERPEGELASGRGGGFFKTQGGDDVQLSLCLRTLLLRSTQLSLPGSICSSDFLFPGWPWNKRLSTTTPFTDP